MTRKLVMKKVLNAIFCVGLPERDIKNANRVNLLALVWAITLGTTTFLLDNEWFNMTPVILAALAINSSFGVRFHPKSWILSTRNGFLA